MLVELSGFVTLARFRPLTLHIVADADRIMQCHTSNLSDVQPERFKVRVVESYPVEGRFVTGFVIHIEREPSVGVLRHGAVTG